MSIFDHSFFLIAALVYPIASYVNYRKLLARIAAGERVNRPELYNSTMLGLWLLFAGAVAVWAFSDRPWSALGVSLTLDAWFLAATVLMAIGIAFLVAQLRSVRNMDDDTINQYRQSAGDAEILIPRNGNEL